MFRQLIAVLYLFHIFIFDMLVFLFLYDLSYIIIYNEYLILPVKLFMMMPQIMISVVYYKKYQDSRFTKSFTVIILIHNKKFKKNKK